MTLVQATKQMNALFPDLKEPVDEAVMVDAAAVLQEAVMPASGGWGAMEASRCGPQYCASLHDLCIKGLGKAPLTQCQIT